MPDATVSQETHRHELKTLPEGFVVLKQLSYYEMLIRRDKGSIASMEQDNKTRRRGEPVPNAKMILETLQTWERKYTFSKCIVDHNLTDSNGVELDFGESRIELTLRTLNPVIALEIEKLIEELNGGDGEEYLEDFPDAASTSLVEEPTLRQLPSDGAEV